MSSANKTLALAIIEFLSSSVTNKTINEEFAESIDVAIDCIADAFEVNKDESKTALNGKSLLDVVSELKLKAPAASADTESVEVDEEVKAKANLLKGEGNKAMAAKDFATAIEKYTQAIELDSRNVVYLSNRAAAYSSASKHDKAVEDAEAALLLDPSFSKAYSRLGLAQYALGNAKESMEAYKKGLEVEGSNSSDAMKRGYETAKKRVEEELAKEMPSASAVESTRSAETESTGAGAGAGGLPDLSSMFGGGGMPSLSDMMNNPQVMQAAQNLMSNPDALQGLMNNPMLRQMAQNMGGEGGLEGLMNNPALQNMARSFMGNQGNNTEN